MIFRIVNMEISIKYNIIIFESETIMKYILQNIEIELKQYLGGVTHDITKKIKYAGNNYYLYKYLKYKMKYLNLKK